MIKYVPRCSKIYNYSTYGRPLNQLGFQVMGLTFINTDYY